MSLNIPYIGYVNNEPVDNLVILEVQNERNDIPFTEIKTTGRNLLGDVAMKEISRKFLVKRSNPLNADDIIKVRHLPTDRFKSYPAMYPNSLLSKGVKILNEDFVGFIMKETTDMIVVFGNYVQRYDIPKSKIYTIGGNVILNMNFAEFLTYEVDNYTSLPK
ncbi:hypothetical protein [Candidatus Nitrosocosmicus arcticus]|nr:hypothetical protein [Candidatus Nitrosocosmicus arcticus]